MSAKELLPCPFCGGAPTYAPTDPQDQGDAWSRLSCVNNECAAKPIVTVYDDDSDVHKRECREAWNRRTPIKPSGDTGELRERVARIIDPSAFLFSRDELDAKVRHHPHDAAYALADEILDLIQSERAG